MSQAELVKGIAFPLQPKGFVGATSPRGIAQARGAEKIRDSITLILGTFPGERLMRPDFGCQLKALVFSPNDRATASLASFYVEEALSRWEPRIAVVRVAVENLSPVTGPALQIEVDYRIRTFNDLQQMSFLLPLA